MIQGFNQIFIRTCGRLYIKLQKLVSYSKDNNNNNNNKNVKTECE